MFQQTLDKFQVTCDANMALAADASASYTITCGEAAEGGEVGILECDTCPKCYGKFCSVIPALNVTVSFGVWYLP